MMAIEAAFDKQDLGFEKKGGNNVVQMNFQKLNSMTLTNHPSEIGSSSCQGSSFC
jgi:hypothetical protein